MEGDLKALSVLREQVDSMDKEFKGEQARLKKLIADSKEHQATIKECDDQLAKLYEISKQVCICIDVNTCIYADAW